jgi:alkanesulfonate monooxygenase SsuD/methylene tetrahydromethanopterin reductase-like flavin-dependent oxidoreductase (luciferase family)
MKLELFYPVPYLGMKRGEGGWPLPPSAYDPEVGAASLEAGFRVIKASCDAGFASVNLAEHHYQSALTPNPIVYAAAVAGRVPEARIGVLGVDVPLHNPVDVAEQVAMLDNLLQGRLTSIGLLRGTPNEYLTFGNNPSESAESVEEAIRLIRRAWTEPEPFGWEGRYHRYRVVSVWPRPYQQPHPPILLSANSQRSCRFAARMRADAGFSFQAIDGCADLAKHYFEEARSCGWEPTADNLLYRQMCMVAETDEEAQERYERLAVSMARLGSPAAGSRSELGAAVGAAAAAMGGISGRALGSAQASRRPKRAFNPPFVGSPATVVGMIREAQERIGVGRMELSIPGPPETVIETVELVGRSVIPQLEGARAGAAG